MNHIRQGSGIFSNGWKIPNTPAIFVPHLQTNTQSGGKFSPDINFSGTSFGLRHGPAGISQKTLGHGSRGA